VSWAVDQNCVLLVQAHVPAHSQLRPSFVFVSHSKELARPSHHISLAVVLAEAEEEPSL
jgi:hypothetical protein